MTIIVDIDGTLADNRYRQHYLEGEKKNWDGFFSEMHLDEVNCTVLDTVQRYTKCSPRHDVILLTGRFEKHRRITEMWLKFHGVPYDVLFMRPNDDYRPDHEVKKEIYLNLIKSNNDVFLVLDDRASVVKMWRELGLTCFQVAEGDF